MGRVQRTQTVVSIKFTLYSLDLEGTSFASRFVRPKWSNETAAPKRLSGLIGWNCKDSMVWNSIKLRRRKWVVTVWSARLFGR